MSEKFELPPFVAPKRCPACVCNEVPPPTEPGYAEAYMAGALATLGLHMPLREWTNSLCPTHFTFFVTFAGKCADNQTKWREEEAKK